MATKGGSERFNGTVSSGTAETTLGPYLTGDNIKIGVDAEIINGATAPTTPALLTIGWNRADTLEFVTIEISGSTDSNGTIPLRNFKIPEDSYSYQYKYTGGDDRDVTLKIFEGRYAP